MIPSFASKRGRNNRKRGQVAERELVVIFRAAGFAVLTQAGPNRRDFVAQHGEAEPYSVECKSLTAQWPRPAMVAGAWAQALRQAPPYRPLLVYCLRRQGVKTEWRVYWPDGPESLADWLVRVV